MSIAKCLCGRDFNTSKLRACPACGMSSAQVLQITPDQRRKAAEARQREYQEAQRLRDLTEEQRVAELDAQRRAYIDSAMARMRQSLAEGRTPALHRLILMPTEYSFMGQSGGLQPNVMLMAEAGWDGWEVAAVLPRTTGLALSNNAGRQSFYGGGVGGLTDGAYLLMRLPVTQALMDSRPEYIETILSAMSDLSQATPRAAATPRIQPGDMGGGGVGAPAAAAGGAFIAYGVSRTVYTDEGSGEGDDGGDGGDFDF